MVPEIIKQPKAVVLKTSGINCDEETKFAFEKAGAKVEIIHINEFKSRSRNLLDFQIIAIPGGFSYGDDVASGRIFALEITSFLKDELNEFIVKKNRPVIGICNGFQILAQIGLLPFGKITSLDMVKIGLAPNKSERFESRWVFLHTEESICRFVKSNEVITLPIAHGEGRFFASDNIIRRIEQNKQVVLRYCSDAGNIIDEYPVNPNGSINSIAGICDETGIIFGLMPHPERFVEKYQHPNFRRLKTTNPDGLDIFKRIVKITSSF